MIRRMKRDFLRPPMPRPCAAGLDLHAWPVWQPTVPEVPLTRAMRVAREVPLEEET